MEEKIEERIELYCHIYERVYQRLSSLNIGDIKEVALNIFEQVVREPKDETSAQKSGKDNKIGEGKEKLATERQREALHKFGVKKVPENLSMREASKILNRLISLSKENDRASIDKAIDELNRDWV